jgi:hypothetical protein
MSETFRPVLKEDGSILAGGMKLAELQGRTMVWEDSHLPRINARGTPDVTVDVEDLCELLLAYFRGDLTAG